MTNKNTVSAIKPWLKTYPENAHMTKLPTMKAVEYLYYENSGYLNGIALEYFGRKITYKELFDNIDKTARAFKTIGVKKGDYIPVCAFPTPEAVYTFYALNRIGAVPNMINPLLEKEQVKYQLENPKYDYVIMFEPLFNHLNGIIRESGIKNTILITAHNSMPSSLKNIIKLKEIGKFQKQKKTVDNLITWNQFIKNGLTYNGELDVSYEPNSALAVVYSSGSTGIPKGIVLSDDGINATVHQHRIAGMEFIRGKKYLNLLPLFLSTGITSSLHLPLCLGVTTILDPRFDENIFADQLAKYKPQYVIVNPNHWFAAIDSGKLDNIDLSFFIYPIIGGENTSRRNEERINKYFAQRGFTKGIGKGAGQSELGAVICVTKDNYNPLFSQGQILPHINAGIFNPKTGEELGLKERGELYVNSPSRMLCFYNDSKKTDDYFENGYGKTGDIASIDEDGNVFYYGRKDDNYKISEEETIYLFDISTVIQEDYRVNLVKTVKIETDTFPVIAINISLFKEFQSLEKEVLYTLDEMIKEHFPKELPIVYKFWTKMPISKVGKIDGVLLKKQTDGFLKMSNKEIKKYNINK